MAELRIEEGPLGIVIPACIEIPSGSRNKYEAGPDGSLWLDRVLWASLVYPMDYGYVPNTAADDGDPLDIMVAVTEPTFPGCHIPARLVGALNMTDNKGPDSKIISVCAVDPRFHHIGCIDDFGPHFRAEVTHFFLTYKELEGKSVTIDGWLDAAAAVEMVRAAAAAAAKG